MERKRTNAPRDHAGKFKRPDVARNSVDRVIRMLAPNDRPETLIALFDGKASYHAIRAWRRRARAPKWAAEILEAKVSAELSAIAQMKTGLGREASYQNLGAWRAARNSER